MYMRQTLLPSLRLRGGPGRVSQFSKLYFISRLSMTLSASPLMAIAPLNKLFLSFLGYMSDGDVLRNVGYRSGNASDLDGYMSEGGASLYAHRLNQRFKEGMRQVHESMNKVQHFIQDDR